MRLFATQSEYADRVAAAVEAENHCTNQMRLLIDQISMQQGRIVALEDEKKRRDEECGQLKALVKDLERRGLERLVDKVQVPVAAVVIMACNRANYLERTINSVFKYVLTFRYQGSVASKYPLFVSQDGSNPQVKSKALSYDKLTYMQHLDFEPVHADNPGELTAYYKIARHYKWALDNLFYKHNFSRVIILEDDMEIAPDFFDYFEAAADLLDKDKSIMAVSSWNDNGQKQFVHDPYVLYRSDFFPGLGWMLTRTTWDELSPKWPKAYPCCYFSLFFFSLGSSLGQFFQQYLAPIKLNDVPVDWKSRDLSYLIKDNYEKYFAEIVKKATPVHGENVVLKAHDIEGDVRIEYKDQSHFEIIARQFGIFNEWKDGIPRTAYKGVVVFRYQTPRRIFLVGPDSLRQLGIKDP
ncbi:alpha-1,3-mannosyl-glycoprotein 2-beta-N-acetylglucosaminyltransferase [Citrus sinensis]|nr:alpha-1,3-mannosyl-glycoprotein 2-beta-N-acetylglucosaminyltransferase [Citrus sinensis]